MGQSRQSTEDMYSKELDGHLMVDANDDGGDDDYNHDFVCVYISYRTLDSKERWTSVQGSNVIVSSCHHYVKIMPSSPCRKCYLSSLFVQSFTKTAGANGQDEPLDKPPKSLAHTKAHPNHL